MDACLIRFRTATQSFVLMTSNYLGIANKIYRLRDTRSPETFCSAKVGLSLPILERLKWESVSPGGQMKLTKWLCPLVRIVFGSRALTAQLVPQNCT